MAKRRKRFTGKLAEPIRRKRYRMTILSGPSSEAVAELQASEMIRVHDETYRKLDLLFAHYGVTPGDYKMLALKLAREIVPGLRVVDAEARKRGGVKKERDPWNLMRLLDDVDKIKKQCGWQLDDRKSDTKALEKLTTLAAYEDSWGAYANRLKTLANMLGAARDPEHNFYLRLKRKTIHPTE